MKYFRRVLLPLMAAMVLPIAAHAEGTVNAPARVTIIYDAFGKPSNLERGWGYSALVEYGGKRILFDTGGQYKAFANNVKALNIDLKNLDFVVLSHRHGDHTAGLAYVLQQNPHVKIYAPLETGSFGAPTAGNGPIGLAMLRKVDGLPGDLHYFDGKHADNYPVDSPWPDANITLINKPVEVAPGFFLFKTVSDNKGTLELNELSMAIKTPKGLAVIVGCSHPGIEKILAVASQIDAIERQAIGIDGLADGLGESLGQFRRVEEGSAFARLGIDQAEDLHHRRLLASGRQQRPTDHADRRQLQEQMENRARGRRALLGRICPNRIGKGVQGQA